MTYVLDASPLVVLASADRLSLLDHFGECVCTDRVRAEVVVAGREHGYADADRIARAIDDGRLAVRPVDETGLFGTLVEIEGLSAADASVLALAAETEATVVMDETIGRDVADARGIESRGTPYLVLSLVADGVLSAEEGRTVVDELVDAGWYCSTDLYRRIRTKLDDIETGWSDGPDSDGRDR